MIDVENFAQELKLARRNLSRSSQERSTRELLRALDRIEALALRRPKVALLGEPNAGKTSLANALLGVSLLPELSLANTTAPTVLQHGEKLEAFVVTCSGRKRLDIAALTSVASLSIKRLEISLPSARLKSYDVVDTPGIAHESEAFALTPLDVPVWCTVAGQAWKESERSTWDALPRRLRQSAILAVTSSDTLKDPSFVEKVRARLNEETEGLFRAIVFTSTARENGEARGAHHHGIASLERAISDVISSRAVRSTRTARRITGRILGVAGEQLPQRPQGQHRLAEHRVEGV